MNPLDRLKYHVTGAIERGEKQAIIERRAVSMVEAQTRWNSHTKHVLNRDTRYLAAISCCWTMERGAPVLFIGHIDYPTKIYFARNESGHVYASVDAPEPRDMNYPDCT